MLVPRMMRGLLKRTAEKNSDVEMSEELTNAYFGNHDAWRITDLTNGTTDISHDATKNTADTTNEEP